MKNNLTTLNVSRLHHAEFGQLIVRFFEDFSKAGLNATTDADFKTMFDALQDQIPTFNSAQNQVQASEESKDIAKLDEVRDDALQNLRNALKPYRKTNDTEEAGAYQALSLLISEYKDAEDDSLEAETNKLNTLADRLESADYTGHVTELGIGKFVSRLKNANTEFNELFSQRSYKTSQKDAVNVKLLRKNMAADYDQMINYVAALAAVKSGNYYKDILTVINNGRTYFADTVLARRKPGNPPANPVA